MVYELDKPVNFCGEWYVAVADKYKKDLYLRRDLTIQEGAYTNDEDEPNNGLWKTKKEATNAIRDYYKRNSKCSK